MNSHPGGEAHTLHMLELARLSSGRAIDLGAGAGDSLRLMRSAGIEAVGIDLEPRSADVIPGNMLALPYPDSSFDAALAQCSFYVSGNVEKALAESCRILKSGGRLMLSDVCFCDIEPLIKAAGFEIEQAEDMTAQWREYYFEALWNGTAGCCQFRGKCRYMLYICRKV